MRRGTLLAVAAALCLASGGGSALAQTSVAVLGVEAVDAPINTAVLLANALKNRVRQTSGFKLVAGKDLDEIKLVFGCVDEKPACMARAGKSLQAAKLVWGSLKKTSSGFNLTIKWLDVTRARIEKFVSENITGTRITETMANTIVARVTRSFLVSSSGMIKITSNVSGAQVMLGPRVIGQTDAGAVVLRDVPSGTHLVRVTKDGYRPWTQQVMVRGGQTTELEAELEPLPAGEVDKPPITEPPPKPGKSRGWKIAFWSGAAATVGLAIGMGVMGASVLSLEEDKEQAIRDYRRDKNDKNAFKGDDVCSDAMLGKAPKLQEVCDDGQANATVTNALLGATLAVAALSGYFYYKAYISDDESPSPSPDADDSSEESAAARRSTASSGVRWLVSPSAGPDGGGVGFMMEF